MAARQAVDKLSRSSNPSNKSTPSIFHGPSSPPLVTLTLGRLLDLQCRRFGSQECLIVPWTNTRWTYDYLSEQSISLAKTFVDVGICPGDRIGIMAGNCEQYVASMFAAARAGAILVVLNNTYTADEAMRALQHTGCKVLLTTFKIGNVDNDQLISRLCQEPTSTPLLEEIMILHGPSQDFRTYDAAISAGASLPNVNLAAAESSVAAHDISMLLFTSGSTGMPKAASLTHHNIINNSRFIGDRMNLSQQDVLCCPPPLFHCFGLVLGLLAVMTHGGKIIYPGEVFNPALTLKIIAEENCTALHGVPAMFDSLFELPRDGLDFSSLRTGIVAGAPVPKQLMEKMLSEFGMTEFTSSYGLTEASPTCFNSFTYDSIERKLTTVGTLMPHAHAKIIDRNGNIVPVGVKGELCIAGYQLQAGYWLAEDKTAEVMVYDEDGVLWLRTGDEAVFDAEGYCSITGRFKELIIRGGENIYPLEIEERLVQHPAIDRAIVVGIKHKRLGEVVGAFLQKRHDMARISDADVKLWIREKLGRHKSPAHVFWLGEDGIVDRIPLTGSGKVQKFVLRDLAEQRLQATARL